MIDTQITGLLAEAHIFWNFLRCVIYSVHGVHFRELHHTTIGKLPGGIKLSSPVVALKDVHGRDLQGTRLFIDLCAACAEDTKRVVLESKSVSWSQ